MQTSVPPPLPPRGYIYHDAAYDNPNRSINEGDFSGKVSRGVQFMVPFQRPGRLIGRESYMANLERLLRTGTGHKRIALYGLGGIGLVILN